MSSDREEVFVGGCKLDHLYTHKFSDEAGKFFNVVTTEDGTTIEYEEPKSIRNRLKLTVRFLARKNDIDAVTFKKFKFYKNEGWKEQYCGFDAPLTFTHFSMEKLVAFLQLLTKLDLVNVNERRIPLAESVGINPENERKLRTLLLQPDGQRLIEELLSSGYITSRDLVNIGYRKGQLEVFNRLLRESDYLSRYADEQRISASSPERVWQHFLQRNDWIFGFGLDYQYLSILQREAHLGAEDLAGRGSSVGDFLMGARNFTVLVEVKLPTTPFFGRSQNRANSWQLSRELIEAVSQILEQKASWQVKAEVNVGGNYDDSGTLIRQRTLDPKCILVFGALDELAADSEKERDVKLRTLELFRRDSRNIEIVTYDELYDRAAFIVSHGVRD